MNSVAAVDPHDVGSAAKEKDWLKVPSSMFKKIHVKNFTIESEDKDVRTPWLRPRMEQDAPPQAARSELPDTESLKPSPAFEATRGWCRRGAALAPLLQRACPGPPGTSHPAEGFCRTPRFRETGTLITRPEIPATTPRPSGLKPIV
jgi:hypothetical protein